MPRNRKLDARLAELGMTRVELADALNEAIEDITGEPGRATDRYIRLLLAGRFRWPHNAHRTALERVLGVPATELGFVPRVAARTGPGRSDPTRRRRPVTPPENLDRREVLPATGGATISVTIPALPVHGRLGVSDVDRQRATLVQLIGVDERFGGVALATVAERQGRRLMRALAEYDMSDQVERAMYALAGEYLGAAGWFAVDADAPQDARGYLDDALRASCVAREPMLQAQIWNTMCMLARETGDTAEAHAVAKAGLASTAARRDPRVAALFHARVACGHAARGEPGRAARSIGLAAAALDRVDPDEPTPTWLRFFDRAQLAALAAVAANALGRYASAEEHALDDLRMLPRPYGRNRVHGVLHLAEARLGRAEVEQAAGDARLALSLARDLRGGVRVGRVARRLRSLRARLARWDADAVAEWVDAYDLVAAAPPAFLIDVGLSTPVRSPFSGVDRPTSTHGAGGGGP